MLNLFRVTVADVDLWSLKLLHTFLKKYFVPRIGEIWTESYGTNYTLFLSFFDEKLRFFKTIFHKVLMPFWKSFFLFVFVFIVLFCFLSF